MAEAIGLALAVVPLLISAAEHYGDTVRTFTRYRQYSKGVARLVAILKIQRVIFRGAVKCLLLNFVDEETAVSMLGDVNHYCWTDGVVSARFEERFGDDCEALSECVTLIKAELNKLDRKVAHFDDAPIDRLSIKKKIKYALTEESREKSITQVRALTEDFSTLINQNRAPAERRKSEGGLTVKVTDGRFRIVQMAASQLYEALGAACTKHAEHQAHLNLEPAYDSPRPQVRFRLAFRQRASTMIDRSCSSFLTVESSVTGFIVASNGNGAMTNLKEAVKRSSTCAETETPKHYESKKLKKKIVRFRSPSPSNEHSVLAHVVPNTVPLPALVNLCRNSNLCNQLQNFLAHAKLGQCIGFLEHCSKSKHLIYLDSRERSTSTGPPCIPAPASMTLTELLSELGSGNALSALSPYEQTKLGRQLAQAVLHFHATPWLKTNWSSSDIILYGVDLHTDVDRAQSNEPYLSVAVRGSKVPLARPSTSAARTLIRNPLVFRLGVMLLELAFQAPLKSLQKPADVDIHEENTLYCIADRVRKALYKRTGSTRYAEVAPLQNAFFRDVVQELESREALLRERHLDS